MRQWPSTAQLARFVSVRVRGCAHIYLPLPLPPTGGVQRSGVVAPACMFTFPTRLCGPTISGGRAFWSPAKISKLGEKIETKDDELRKWVLAFKFDEQLHTLRTTTASISVINEANARLDQLQKSSAALASQVAALELDAATTKGSMEDTLMGIEHDITETNKEIKDMKDENTMLRNRMYETLMQESKGLVTAVLKEVKDDGLKETQQLLTRMETFNIALLGKQDYIDKHSEQLGDVAEVLLKLQRETQQCLLTKADHQEITKLKKQVESSQELKSQVFQLSNEIKKLHRQIESTVNSAGASLPAACHYARPPPSANWATIGISPLRDRQVPNVRERRARREVAARRARALRFAEAQAHSTATGRGRCALPRRLA